MVILPGSYILVITAKQRLQNGKIYFVGGFWYLIFQREHCNCPQRKDTAGWRGTMVLFSTLQCFWRSMISLWRCPWISFKAPRLFSRSSGFLLRVGQSSLFLRANLGSKKAWGPSPPDALHLKKMWDQSDFSRFPTPTPSSFSRLGIEEIKGSDPAVYGVPDLRTSLAS